MGGRAFSYQAASFCGDVFVRKMGSQAGTKVFMSTRSDTVTQPESRPEQSRESLKRDENVSTQTGGALNQEELEKLSKERLQHDCETAAESFI